MKITVFTSISEFHRQAITLFEQRAVESNLAWGLLNRYLKEGKSLATMLTLSDKQGVLRYVGLQTDAHRAFILVGPTTIVADELEGLLPFILKTSGLITGSKLVAQFRPFLPQQLTEETYMLLYELSELSETVPLSGNLIKPNEDHLKLLTKWIQCFSEEVREVQPDTDFKKRAAQMIASGVLRLLIHNGQAVSMVASTRSAGGVACINYVYTPKSLRGNGYAFACVGLYCRTLLKTHQQCCLYAEEDNPSSNHVYQKIGFLPVMRTLEVGWPM